MGQARLGASYGAHWLGDCAGNWPSALHAANQGRERQPCLFGPLPQSQSLSVVCMPVAAISVLSLDIGGCPAAILRRVRAVVVNPVDAMARRRTWSHVSVKVCEGLPSFTDSNSACAVTMIFLIGRIGASSAHATPRRVAGHVVQSVRTTRRSVCFLSQASARSLVSGPKVDARYPDSLAAIADTVPPKVLLVGFRRRILDSQPAEFLTGRQHDTITRHRRYSFGEPRSVDALPGHLAYSVA